MPETSSLGNGSLDIVYTSQRNDISIEQPTVSGWFPIQEIVVAQGTYIGPTTISIGNRVAYWIELWADPNATGGSISDVVWGVYNLTSAPTGDTDGMLITTGMRHRLCVPLTAIATLYFRKHSQTNFPCRFRAIPYTGDLLT
jgi:hypothetical protein